ncbi:iron-containing alcohol dehydrogenase family protein [Fredinandcohnia sp. 179-A 10B2 NHS]|uniref:iron-containing alcohol dehydrogenase family protein n=1 Tax=Fredinandcohnia sp. 179-A 10B2 NHS TaxID=3235176 RepID=UPI0039A0A041
METISVHGAPSEYIASVDILNQLERKLEERGIKRALVVTGEKSWQAAKPYFPELKNILTSRYTYGGECSLNEIESLCTLVNEQVYDAVIAVGGGKVLDLVKAVCHKTGRQSVLIPTLPSNCSAWTPISVLYDENGAFIRYDIFPISASLVLIEPRILLHAPLEMFVAGIGDTLAKWYEADVQMAGIKDKPVVLQISHYTAEQCKNLLLEHAREAIAGAKTGVLSEAFVNVTEAIIVLGGMVGGFGDKYGRIAGAHSIHNGLTAIDETHYALHGDKVAYGILVQLVLENKWDEVEELLLFYREIGLPLSLSELGISNVTETTIQTIASKAAIPGESIHAMPIGEITPLSVSNAMIELEKYVEQR